MNWLTEETGIVPKRALTQSMTLESLPLGYSFSLFKMGGLYQITIFKCMFFP